MNRIRTILAVSTLLGCSATATQHQTSMDQTPATFHQLSIGKLNSDETIQFSDFKGKKVLLVNVASKCGFTYQYKGLQNLHSTYGDSLVVIGFPCNQFLFQEPGSEAKIDSFCRSTYDVGFLMSEKIKVKGDSTHPVYQWLTRKEFNGVGDYKIKWNFNKFLVNEEGQLIGYWDSRVEPEDEKILSLIRQDQ